MKKINGFTQKAHLYQIMAYIFFSSITIIYFLVIFPLSSSTARGIGLALELTIGLTIFISGYITTASDPSDTCRTQTLKAREEGKEFTPLSTDFRCTIENTYVHSSSKHCKRCGRCTEGFDHHCKWVNNDIGKKNYKPFIVLISSATLYLALFLVLGAIVTARYSNDPDFTGLDIYIYQNKREQILGGMVFLWILMPITSVFFLMITNLVLLHIFLISKGITTFQYIMLVQERREHAKEMEIARLAMGEQKKTCLDFILCLENKKKSAPKNPPPTEDLNTATHPKKPTDRSRTSESSESDSNYEEEMGNQEEVPDQSGLQQAAISQPRDVIEILRKSVGKELPEIYRGARESHDNIDYENTNEYKESSAFNEAFSPLGTFYENGEITRQLKLETFQIKTKDIEINKKNSDKRKLMISLELIDKNDLRKKMAAKESCHQPHMHSFQQGKYQDNLLSPTSTEREKYNMKKHYESLSARESKTIAKSLLLQDLESNKKFKKQDGPRSKRGGTQPYLDQDSTHMISKNYKGNPEEHEGLNIEVLG